MKRVLVAVLSLVLLGCAGAQRSPEEGIPTHLLDDVSFTATDSIPTTNDIYYLSKESINSIEKDYRERKKHQSTRKWFVNYIHRMFKGFTYVDETRGAEHTLQTEKGNCLSLAILTSAIARQLRIPHVFQEVIAPPTWDRKNGITLVSRHVNVLILDSIAAQDDRGSNLQVLHMSKSISVIDFFPMSKSYPSDLLREDQVAAMFYANLAAKAFIRRDYNQAYWLLRKSIESDPEFAPSFNMLALVYSHTQNPLAPRTFYHALHLEPDSMSTINNFVVWLDHWGQEKEADRFRSRLQRIRKESPFYYYDQAEIAYGNGNYRAAILLYRKAIFIDEFQHEFHFGLYRSYLALDNHEKATISLRKAIEQANDEELSTRYLSKLENLSKP